MTPNSKKLKFYLFSKQSNLFRSLLEVCFPQISVPCWSKQVSFGIRFLEFYAVTHVKSVFDRFVFCHEYLY